MGRLRESPLLDGLIAVIQDEVLAVPTHPPGEGARADQLVVQQDSAALVHQGQRMGLLDPGRPLIGLHKAGLHLFPTNRAIHSAQPSVAALTMVAKSGGFREAPPMTPPSTSGWARSSAALPA